MSRGVETRCAPMGVWLRDALARGVGATGGGVVGAAGGAEVAALGDISGVARLASARMRGVITGVGIVEKEPGVRGPWGA